MFKGFALKNAFMLAAICSVAVSAIGAKNPLAKIHPFEGTSDYRELVLDGKIYIDKTLLIRDIIESDKKTILITRPRRWGKSTNLSMLQYFFAAEVDEKGNSAKRNSNRALFEGGEVGIGYGKSKTLRRSNIALDPLWETKYQAMQGSYPVILLSFKDIKDSSYVEMEEKIRMEISRAYIAHAYLANILGAKSRDPEISPEDAESARSKLAIFQRLHLDNGIKASKTELHYSLKFLSELLYKHHGKRVFILVDEYDTPLNEAYVRGYFEEVRSLVSGIFAAAFKENVHLEKGIITGILRMAKANLFSDISNFTEDSVLTKSGDGSGSFAPYYGFTREEVQNLLKASGREAYFEAVKAYYNGYNIDGIEIYNPWSIVNFLEGAVFKTYWLHSGGTDLLQKAIVAESVQEDIQILREGGTITKTFSEQIRIFNIENDSNALWALLLYAGYLTPQGPISHESDEYVATLRIPNTEIKSAFGTFYKEYLEKKRGFSSQVRGTMAKANSLYDAIVEKDVIEVKTQLVDTHFSSGWNLNALHLAALVGDEEILGIVSKQHKSLLESKGQEQMTPKDFSFLAGHNPEKLAKYNTALQQALWQEKLVCSPVKKIVGWGVVGLGTAALVRMAMAQPAQQAAAAPPAQQPAQAPPLARRLLQLLQEHKMVLSATIIPPLIAYFSNDQVTRLLGDYCKDYNAYHRVDISKPPSMTTLLQFEKYRMEHPDSYVVVNQTCRAMDSSIANIDVTPYEDKPAPVRNMRLTLCQPLAI